MQNVSQPFLLEAVLYFELFLCAKKDLQIANIGKIVSQEENIFLYFRVIESWNKKEERGKVFSDTNYVYVFGQ